mgnify:CR=1 FL=1
MTKKYPRYLALLVFLLADYLAIVGAENLALRCRNWTVTYTVPLQYTYFWVPLIFFVFLAQTHAYTKMQPLLDSVRSVFCAVIYGVVSCIILLFVFKESIALSRIYAGLFSIFVVFAVLIVRYLLRLFLKKAHLFYEPVILIGAGRTAERVLRFFKGDLGYRYDIKASSMTTRSRSASHKDSSFMVK